MFTTSNEKTRNLKVSRIACVVRSHAFCLYAARVRDVRRTIHTYIHIYIYQKNSAVQLTSVGLAQARPNNIEYLPMPLGCLPYCERANCLHQRWTRKLLRGSALLPRPSTLKLLSLPVASGASFHLALGDASRLALIPHRQ